MLGIELKASLPNMSGAGEGERPHLKPFASSKSVGSVNFVLNRFFFLIARTRMKAMSNACVDLVEKTLALSFHFS